MGSLTNDELPKYFQQMGDEYQGFTDRTRRHKFRLEASEYNKALTNKLFEKGYISSREEKRELLENKKGTRLVTIIQVFTDMRRECLTLESSAAA